MQETGLEPRAAHGTRRCRQSATDGRTDGARRSPTSAGRVAGARITSFPTVRTGTRAVAAWRDARVRWVRDYEDNYHEN